MPSLGSAYIQVRGDLSQLNKQLVANLHPARLGKFGKAAGVGIGAGLAAGFAGKGLFDLGKRFDDSFDQIRVATGKTGAELDGLKGDFKEVFKSVPSADFDATAKAVGGLGARLNIAGKPLQRLSQQLLRLADITGTDVQENVESVTRLFKDWAVPTEKQSFALDKLFRVFQKTGLTVDKNARLLVAFGSPLRQLGFDMDEAAAMFGRFEKEGVNMQTILPGFRFALKNLSAPTSEVTTALKKLGAAGKEPRVALQAVFDAIKNAPTDLEANALAFTIFGKRAGPDMAAAVREGRLELDALMASMQTGDTINKASRDTEDFTEKWQRLKKEVFVGLEPLASKTFDTISDGMTFVSEHLSAFKELAKIIGALTAAFVSYRVAVGGAAAATRAYAVLAGTAATQSAVAATATTAAGAQATAAGAAAGGAAGGFKTLAARMIGVATGAYIGLEAGKALGKEFSEQGQGNKLKGFTKIVGDLGETLLKIRKPSDLGDLFKGSPTEEADKRAAPFLKAQREELFKNAAAEDRIRIARDQARASIPAIVAAERRLVTIRAEGKGGTHAEAVAIRALDAAQGARLAAVRESVTAEKEAERTAERGIGAAFKAYEAAKQQGLGARDLAKYIRGVARANSNWYASQVNITRAMRGLTPVTEASKRQLGDLLRTLKGVKGIEAFKKFTVTADISSVNAAIRLTSKLQDMGRVKTALKIIADAKSPEQALERLRKKLRDLEDRRHRFLVEMRDEATLRLDRLIRKVGDLPRGKITVDVVGGRMSVATKLERALADALTRVGQGQAGKAFKIRPQRGGMIPGTGEGDKVPALLEPGEGVINKKAVRAMGGSQVINRINRRVPRFQRGGFVRPVSASFLPHQHAGKEQSDVEANYHDQRSQRNLLERHGSILRLARTLGIPAFATGGVVRREPISPTAQVVKTGDKYAVVDGKRVVRVVDRLRDIDRSRTDSSPVQSIRDIRDATLREAITKAATERSTSKDTSSIVDRSAIRTTAERMQSKFAQVRDVATSSLREAITDRHDSHVSRDTLRDISRTKESALRETLKGGLVERTSERGSASLVERLRASSVTDRSHVSERVSSVLRAVGESVRTSAQDRRTFRETVQELTGRPTPDVARQPDHVPVLSKLAEVRTTLSGRGHGRLVIASHSTGGQGGGLAAHADPRPESTEATHRVANIASNIFESVRSRLSTDQRLSEVGIQAFAEGGTVKKADKPKKRTYRQPTRELAERIWKVAGPLYPGAGPKMPRLHLPKQRQGQGGVYTLFPSEDSPPEKRSVFLPRRIAKDLLKGENYVEQTLLHEWTHVFQRPSLENWEAEGGATAFARRIAPKVFKRLRRPFVNPTLRGDPYQRFVRHVKEARGEDWIAHGQFAADPQASKKLPKVKAKMAAGGVMRKTALALVGEQGPEIAELPVGTRVHSHPVSKRIAKGLGIQAFAKGGTVKPDAAKSTATYEDGSPKRKDDWEAIAKRVRARMRRVWKESAPLFRARGEGLPSFQLARHIPKNLRDAYAWADGQTVVFPKGTAKQFLKGSDSAESALLHEWAHVFQHPGIDKKWMVEGGAEAFERRKASQVYRRLDVPFKRRPVSPSYAGYRRRVEGDLGAEWIMDGQFGYGPTRNKDRREEAPAGKRQLGDPVRKTKAGGDSVDSGRRIARTASKGLGTVTPSEVTQITQRWGVNRAVASIAAAVEDKFPAMRVISGFRSGATTKSGSRSNHAIRAALDLGSRGSLNRRIGSWVRANFSNSLRGVSEGVLDIDHDPNPPDHADHVHVAALGSEAISKVMQTGADGGGTTRPRRFKKLSLGQYVTVAKQVGFPDPALAAAIFYAESRGDVNAVGDSGQSMGAAQIHLPSHPRLAKQKDKLRDDIFFNFREAKKIARGGRDFSPWTQFRNGAYKPFLGGRAQRLPKGGKGAPPSGSSLADYWAFWQDEATETPGLKDDYKWINKQMSYWRGVLRRNKASNPTRAKEARGNIRQLREDKKALRPEIPDDAFTLGDLAFIGKDVVVPPGKRFPGSGPPPDKSHTWDGTRWVEGAVFRSRRVNIGGIQKTLDRIDLDIAAAGLTETFDGNGNVTPASYADDIKAATEFVNVWTGVKQLAFGGDVFNPLAANYDRQGNITSYGALTKGFPGGTIKQKTEAATNLKGAKDALKSVQDEAKSEEIPPSETAVKTDLSAVFAEIAEIMRLYAPNFRALPSFEKGGTLKRTAEALVGEQGREIAEVPVSGARKALTVLGQSGPEIRPLPIGTRIYSHPESKRIAQDLGIQAFAEGGVVRPVSSRTPEDGFVRLEPAQMEALIKALKEQQPSVVTKNIDARSTFEGVKAEPHTWSKSVAFELEAA